MMAIRDDKKGVTTVPGLATECKFIFMEIYYNSYFSYHIKRIWERR